MLSERRVAPPRLPRWLRVFVTFHLVCLGWILFRAQSLGEAGEVFRGLLRPGFQASPLVLETLLLVVACGKKDDEEAGPLTFTTYNAGLAVAFVPSANERAPMVADAVATLGGLNIIAGELDR